MASQPISYGIDAGKRVDQDGNADENLRLATSCRAGGWRNAAGARSGGGEGPEVTVLLTKRTAHLLAHSGQIAFPGGKIEEIDKTPVEAAIREAEEEIGMPPELVHAR